MSVFEQVFEVSAGQLVVTTSAGVTTLRPDRDSSNQTLMRDADTAMYRAKAVGGGRCVRFVEEMRAEIAEHVAVEQRLRRAVATDGFELHYQPIVNLVDGTVRGYEALLRMRPDGLAPLRPDEFIPVAESTGLILPIGAFVLDEACRQIAQWREQPSLDMESVFVAVNVSSRQLHEHGFVAEVLGALERHRVPERCLHIEITESLLMDDIEMAIEMLDVLRDRGINISVDDFGTGHSSLGYLKRLPVGTVKIDRSFVSGLGDLDSADGRDDEAIVRAVMGMAKALNLSVVAEGVETAAQRDVLRAMGCTYAQGWLYGRPMLPIDAADAWNRTHQTPAIAS
jgi:EAL domain-containing protein (putative c-di-GMP-specific phosphodiesterase class I)